MDKNKKETNDLIITFNEVMMGMVKYLTEYHEDINTMKIKIILENIIETAFEEPIAFFVLNVYNNDKYRENILKQNDDFFLSEHFGTESDETMMQIFEFKTLWGQIDEDTKKFIKRSMIALVKISQKYILSI
jgi:hypothetical protein